MCLLTLERRVGRWGCKCCTFLDFLKYLRGPTELFDALWHIPRAIQFETNEVEIPDLIQLVIRCWHRKRRCVDGIFSRKVVNLVTFKWRSVFHPLERKRCCFANFWERRSRRCCSQYHTMLNSIRVQPEIKMADVIPETHAVRITDLE